MDNLMNSTSSITFPAFEIDRAVVNMPATETGSATIVDLLVEDLLSQEFGLAIARVIVASMISFGVLSLLRSKPVNNALDYAVSGVVDCFDWTWNGIISLWADAPPAPVAPETTTGLFSPEQIAALSKVKSEIWEKAFAEVAEKAASGVVPSVSEAIWKKLAEDMPPSVAKFQTNGVGHA